MFQYFLGTKLAHQVTTSSAITETESVNGIAVGLGLMSESISESDNLTLNPYAYAICAGTIDDTETLSLNPEAYAICSGVISDQQTLSLNPYALGHISVSISDNETLSLNPVAYGQMHINLDDDEILNVGINLTGNPQENHSILGNLIAQLCISSNIAESESISPEIIPFAILSGAIAQNCPSMGIGEGLGLLGDVIIQQDHFIVTVKTEIFSVVASQIATLLDTRQIQEISSVFQVSNNKQYGSVMQIGE